MKHRTTSYQQVASLALAMLSVLFATTGSADTLFAANDPRINYYGRFDVADPLLPRWNWSGSTIEACFSGKTVGISLLDGNADYDIEIDGGIDTVLRTKVDVQRYDVGVDTDAMHTLRIMQRSENHATAAAFKGLYLADGKTLGDAPPKPSRKIEFIGNSDLVAYGVENTAGNCSSAQLRKYTNTNRSYGALVAEAFHAQSVILGWSGKGMVRNYDSPAKRSSTSFPAYYDKTLGMLESTWDFTRWIPDLVVIVLGWNDFSSCSSDETKCPDDTMFIGDYHKFIGTIRGHYPDAAVLCVTTHIGNLVDYIKRVVDEETGLLQHKKVYFAEYPPDASFTLTGCNGHPSPDDHRLIARMLIDTIHNKLGWDKVNVDPPTRGSRSPGMVPFDAHARTHGVYITGTALAKQGNIAICRIDGTVAGRVTTGRDNRTVVPAARFPAGVYFAGNAATGWKRFAILK